MKIMSPETETVGRRVAAATCAALLIGACTFDKPTIPALSGPSVLGTALEMTANPDAITADGVSTSLIQVKVFNQNGAPSPGTQILLALADANGNQASIGTLTATSGAPLQSAQAVVTTDSNGSAVAVYTAPARTDATSNTAVEVQARPLGTDFNGAVYRSVTIELRSANSKLFPIVSSPTVPVCNFVVEAPLGDATCTGAGAGTTTATTCTVKVGTQVLFQDTSTAAAGTTIVRYEWFYGDGTGEDTIPDTNHVFRTVSPSSGFTVTHRVTDTNGGQSACQATIVVQ
jgi:hypothetical protein